MRVRLLCQSVGTPSPYAQALQGSAANMASGQTYNPGMHPGMVQPGMQPGMMQPGMMQPGMMQPGMMQPGMQQHMMQSGAHYQGMYPNTSMAPGMAPGYTATRTISTGHAPYQAVESPRESQHSAGSGVAYTQPAMVTEREEYAPGPGEQQSEFHQRTTVGVTSYLHSTAHTHLLPSLTASENETF